jgi:hypothetical protein
MCSSAATYDRSGKGASCGKAPDDSNVLPHQDPTQGVRLTNTLAIAALAVLSLLPACASQQQSASVQSLETGGPLFDTVSALDTEVFNADASHAGSLAARQAAG